MWECSQNLRLLHSSLALVSVCSWSFNSVSPRLLNSSVARAVGASALSVLRFPVPVLTSKLQAVVAWFESSSLEFIWLVFLPRRCSLVSTQFYCCLNSFNGYCLKPLKKFSEVLKTLCVVFRWLAFSVMFTSFNFLSPRPPQRSKWWVGGCSLNLIVLATRPIPTR